MKFRIRGKTSARSFKDDRGSVAIMAALVAMPLTLLTFAAVEFYRFTSVRGELQDALDAATLAVARSSETDPVKLQTLGTTVLVKTFGENRTGFTFSNVSFTDTDGSVASTATVNVQPIVASIIGAQQLSATAGAKASRLGEKLEIALVLDNTYSMLTNDRLGFTKVAATNFVNMLATAAGKTRVPDALKLSLVPYSDTVRLAAADRTAWWIDNAGVSPIHDDVFGANVANRFTLLSQMGVSWAGCLETREWPFDVTEAGPSTADPRTLFVPYFAPDEPDRTWNSVHRFRNDYLPDGTTADNWWTRQQNVTKYNRAPTDTTASR